MHIPDGGTRPAYNVQFATTTDGLVDSGFANQEAIEAASAEGVVVYAPLRDEQKQWDAGQDPYAPKKNDSQPVKDWRARMVTEEGKKKYKLRSQTAELVNAQARQRGLNQFPVRGLAKVQVIAKWFAIAHNVKRGLTCKVWVT